MQVRAYNHWASLLEDPNFPAIEDLEPENLPDFGPFSVLLDFSSGIENPGISFLGEKLSEECGVGEEELTTLADVPARSLLTRITDHYMQILANQAPIGFEAEFVNQRGATIAYRGILLPFSSDDDTIDFIYGVINWKELADAQHSDELLLEIDQALEPKAKAPLDAETPLTDWADGPGTELSAEPANDVAEFASDEAIEDYPAGEFPSEDIAGDETEEEEAEFAAADDDGLPVPSFGLDDDEDDEPVKGPSFGSLLKMPIQAPKVPIELTGGFDETGDDEPASTAFEEPMELTDEVVEAPGELEETAYYDPEPAPISAQPAETSGHEIELPELDPSEMELGDWLAAAEAPAEFDELVADSGLTTQDRAPMTPVVKLVFGADYDKTRLTEYAAALTHAHRLGLPRGTLGEFLREAEGGLKGVVKAERRLRKEEAGKEVEPVDAPRHALAKKLRALPPQPFEALAADGSEFALVMIRRTEDGAVVMLGEVPDDVALVERAARRLIG
jgi:hypothetical protein